MWQILAAAAGTMAFAVLFRAPGRDVFLCGAGGGAVGEQIAAHLGPVAAREAAEETRRREPPRGRGRGGQRPRSGTG